MPQSDLIYNADIARKPDLYTGDDRMNCGCEIVNNGNGTNAGLPVEVGYPWIPVPPVPPPMPWPPIPPQPYPPYPVPVPPIDPDDEPKKGSVEAQICKLSKKASAITKMIENLEEKKKDVVIKVGEVSYNFGNIDLEIQGWDDGSYAATVKKILDFELAAIKAKIAELAAEIGDEATSNTDGPVAGQ